MYVGNSELLMLTATDADVDRAHQFYLDVGTDGLVPRTREDVSAQIAARSTVIAQCGGEVAAIASNFEPAYPYVEVGGTLVAKPFRGFGLQKLMFAARFAHLWLNQGPEIVIVTSIKPWVRDSLGSALKVGFEPWSDPAPELLVSCKNCSKRDEQPPGRCCAAYYRIAPDKVRAAIAELLSRTVDAPTLRLEHRDDPRVTLEVTLLLLALYGRNRRALEELAAQR